MVDAEHELERGMARELWAWRQRVGGVMARVVVVGAASGGRWSGRGGRGKWCTLAARQRVGLRCTGDYGQREGPGRGGRAGEGLGDTCELQDMMFHWLACWQNQVDMGWTWLGFCCSRAMWGAGRELAGSRGCVGVRVS